jgi:hypothetical protein
VARPSLEGDSAANAIGAEKIGRTMKRSFCDGARQGDRQGNLDNVRRSFGDQSANAIGSEQIGRTMRRSLSRRSSVMESSRLEAIIKAIGDERRFLEVIVDEALSAIS